MEHRRDPHVRILLIHPHLYVVGGSEILTRIFVYEAVNEGHEVLVLTSAKRDDLFPERKGVYFEFFKKVGDEGIKGRLLDLFETFHEVLSKEEPDAILVMMQEPVYAALIKMAKPGARVALYLHFVFEEEAAPENLPKFLSMYRFPNMFLEFYPLADARISNSYYTAKVLRERVGVESTVVYPAVEWKYFEEEVDVEEPREPLIVTIGRFVPHKRHDKLLELFAERIKPVVPQARLVIIGVTDERYADFYDKLVEKAEKVKDVEVINRRVPPEEMVEYLREASVYVHLRIGEPFGMAPVEAMTQGAIPVIPRRSGLAELIAHGKDGFLYDTDEELVDYVIKLLRMDSAELARMRRAAVRTSWYFTPERFTKELVSCLELMTSGRG